MPNEGKEHSWLVDPERAKLITPERGYGTRLAAYLETTEAVIKEIRKRNDASPIKLLIQVVDSYRKATYDIVDTPLSGEDVRIRKIIEG
ncbi:hypothetical protein A3K34_00830 [candidate division WWE3 bacterium RIFOXYC1_FULL_40_10]|uniref:Uncharacterized protein n=1 Tax=candidate division WWE3 bacterium RIFOXYA2_FULL_46_9 TaxID=1802636 RepID=A0A1F4W1Q7_UNCKA|nr:MAG: hypothetical protein A3K58_00830 [candidate division WWE3 bacterium RIFOXYB1_FULL_40_22]OGC61419.1 MAG: hypothetical protein A3K37_00830 [candidate division WWE3 bacterium RIFOXYA1_FULL_40_11]OGC63352.1 MAG: hypothetical protein A2264_01305 [candidate division WWE3 bacterium RIFOXYA2_FULL_46_9]OGC65442.1 MAG: hypothetical protein A2326_00160 [candidate division WWE3 bacterium RIFOXYB2_FULL_41_6]OGC65802.1 MAG: hypothetical protein A3K34_00830 [candidate division WWE3 bacterium RIFOXYC1_